MPYCSFVGEKKDSLYGKILPGSISNVLISDVICQSKKAIYVAGYLNDSVISNVVNKNPDCPAIGVYREDGLVKDT